MLKKRRKNNLKINPSENNFLQFIYSSGFSHQPKITNIYSNKLNLSVYLYYKHMTLVMSQEKLYQCNI